MPVGGCPPAVEQPGCGQHERPGAYRDHACTAGRRDLQGGDDRLAGMLGRPVARHHNRVRRRQCRQPVLGLHGEPGRGRNRPGNGRTHGEVVALPLGAVPEDLRGDGQVEGDDVRQCQRDDGVHEAGF